MKKVKNLFSDLKTNKLKLGLVIFVILFITGVILNFLEKDKVNEVSGNNNSSNSSNTSNKNNLLSSDNQTVLDNFNYKIIKTDDVSYGNVSRIALRVVVEPEEIAKLNEQEIEQLLKKITQDYLKNKKVKAICVFLYDNQEDINGQYTVAMSEYAPNGDWSKAQDGNISTYAGYDYNIKINKKHPIKGCFLNYLNKLIISIIKLPY